MTLLRSSFLAVGLLVLALSLAACGGKATEPNGGDAASCAMLVRYDDHNYLGAAVEQMPGPGESLGTGTIPPCNDTGGAGTTIPAEEVEVTAVEGVPPTIAIMLAGRTDVVLVREDVEKLPKELAPR
jgi:hypothetical protein